MTASVGRSCILPMRIELPLRQAQGDSIDCRSGILTVQIAAVQNVQNDGIDWQELPRGTGAAKGQVICAESADIYPAG